MRYIAKDLWITKAQEEVWDEFGAKESAMGFMRSLIPVKEYDKTMDPLLGRIFGDCVKVEHIPCDISTRIRFVLFDEDLNSCEEKLKLEYPGNALVENTLNLLYKSLMELKCQS